MEINIENKEDKTKEIGLQKYRLKRQKKSENIQTDLFKSEIIEEAFRGAGKQAISLFNVLRRQDESNSKGDAKQITKIHVTPLPLHHPQQIR